MAEKTAIFMRADVDDLQLPRRPVVTLRQGNRGCANLTPASASALVKAGGGSDPARRISVATN